jgi:regulator of cell morphogenesis and NO signaling
MEKTIELSLSAIVNKFPSAAGLFEKFDLDYCCHGKHTLKEACKDDSTKFEKVGHALHRIVEDEQTNSNIRNFENEDLGVLIDHIVNKHHHYVKESMPMILAHLEKVSTRHGDRNPELLKVYQLFAELKMEMEQHMYKEENILFPRIKEVNNALKAPVLRWFVDRQFLSAPINIMQDEHEKAGDIMHEIKKLTANYTPPAEACTTYRLSFNELKQFEHDLHRHVHLENNILFPRAIAAQNQLGENFNADYPSCGFN